MVREGESVQLAYRRLQRQVERVLGRPSHKRRFGYAEKPSELRRKWEKFRRRQVQAGSRLLLGHPYRALFRRSGPSNTLMG